MVAVLLAVVLLLVGAHHVAVLLVGCQLVLSVRVQVDVLSRDELDLFGGEEEASFGLAAHVHGVDVGGVLPLQVHDVLVVEVLDRSQQILAVAERDKALALVVAADALPNVSEHQLLLFLRNWAHKSELEEELRHLGAPNLDIGPVVVGILWLLNDVELVARLLEISVKPVVHHLVGE